MFTNPLTIPHSLFLPGASVAEVRLSESGRFYLKMFLHEEAFSGAIRRIRDRGGFATQTPRPFA
jgi:hypothetical protein